MALGVQMVVTDAQLITIVCTSPFLGEVARSSRGGVELPAKKVNEPPFYPRKVTGCKTRLLAMEVLCWFRVRIVALL